MIGPKVPTICCWLLACASFNVITGSDLSTSILDSANIDISNQQWLKFNRDGFFGSGMAIQTWQYAYGVAHDYSSTKDGLKCNVGLTQIKGDITCTFDSSVSSM